MALENRRPIIEYPCQWEYRVFGREEEEVRRAVALAVGERRQTTRFSRRSSGGKYCCVHLEVRVENEQERNRIFKLLVEDPATDFVL